ncbi:hydrogenase [Geoalkalibacter halelectricus]|uniref:Hydrogenase n=1 Tax=Geoalkalibacter halelectricus TaxID=2847045 RepID=A0ABY5ZN27_9BACT|nr:hydrogenase [Geoalkalibacter halelectricus]MDO3378290.1 hydrogenase [Geoalkalibacter halelectricus]UWZ79295.1 hydrogenase [Geoalkalibacter halelectricus]
MSDVNSVILLVVILLNFFTLGSARLVACIRAVALQGALLALLPVTVHGLSGHSLILALGALTLKGLFIPWLLLRAIREVRIRREMEPLIGLVPTLFLGVLATVAAFLFADRLPLLLEHQEGLLVPASLATMLTGFLLLMTRRKAITQVVGYLILENGIFVFGVLLSTAMPLVVEAGVLLDLLVAVFVMGIVLNQINREFATINTERLSALKE